ncbi:MAG: hypothetical protein U1C53_02880, partial [Candidatus Veblenbacteria bacterium]|nr:hypothetical protein [Candidatus Veblenbacteria bacterium]
FYHQNHVPTGEATVPLAPSAFAWLTRAATMGVVRAEPLPASVLGFLTDYVQGHAGRELYTLKVLRSIL